MKRQVNPGPEVHYQETEGAGSQKVFGGPGGRVGMGGPNHRQGGEIDPGLCNIGRKERAPPAADPGDRFALLLGLEHQPEYERQRSGGLGAGYLAEPAAKGGKPPADGYLGSPQTPP
jgi:hypothetical protein